MRFQDVKVGEYYRLKRSKWSFKKDEIVRVREIDDDDYPEGTTVHVDRGNSRASETMWLSHYDLKPVTHLKPKDRYMIGKGGTDDS